MLKYNAVVISTTGAPGTGKTYSRCARFLWDWWMPEERGVHWSNFPVNIEAFSKKYPDAGERIRLIPQLELDEWALCDGIHGPWSFFKDKDITGAHIAIDECHNFVRKTGIGSKINANRWQLWLGEIRHRKASVEFLSQDPHKVHGVIEQHAAVRIQLVNSEDRRDPLLGCLLGDWYELRAMVSGEYEAVIWQLEERRLNGKWVQSEFSRFTLEPRYFVLYDSFNKPQSEINAEGEEAPKFEQLRQFQKRSKLGLLLWFFKRNWFRLVSRSIAFCVIIWLCFFGGAVLLISEFNKRVSNMATSRLKDGNAAGGQTASTIKDGETNSGLPMRRRLVPAAPAVAGTESKSVIVDDKKPDPVAVPVAEPVSTVVRSETSSHKPLETPPSAEAQQLELPRVLYMSRDFCALDDGLSVLKGEAVGEWVLMSVDYSRRVAVFGGLVDCEKTITVPVGGPVGVRVRKAAPVVEQRPENVAGGLTKIVPATPTGSDARYGSAVTGKPAGDGVGKRDARNRVP